MPYISVTVVRALNLNWKFSQQRHMGVGQFAAHPLQQNTSCHLLSHMYQFLPNFNKIAKPILEKCLKQGYILYSRGHGLHPLATFFQYDINTRDRFQQKDPITHGKFVLTGKGFLMEVLGVCSKINLLIFKRFLPSSLKQ